MAEFHQLRSAPWLESRRLILVEGEILEVVSPDPPHGASLGLTKACLRGVFGPNIWVRGQMALVLGLATDPVPDLAVVRGSPREYTEHPRTALLVIEISESSLAYDCGDRADLYAAGGIGDYWVIDLIHRQVVVHRGPISDPVRLHGARYQKVNAMSAAERVSPLAAPGQEILVRDLLP